MNKDNAELIFLGTGGSMGVPVVGCSCPVCRSTSSRNKRLRPSALIRYGDKQILIDAGPDFRTQALKHSLERLDGVIFTHAHHDHTSGVDDLRVYNMWMKKAVPCLLSSDTAKELQDRYKYIFSTPLQPKKLVSRIKLCVLENSRGETEFEGLKIKYFSYKQAGMQVNGFRFGNLGFISDIKDYPDSIFDDLQGIEKLVVSALRHETSLLHFSIGEAIGFSKKVGAKKTWLTHIAHDVDHDSASKDLPSNVFLAYDGLSIKFQM